MALFINSVNYKTFHRSIYFLKGTDIATKAKELIINHYAIIRNKEFISHIELGSNQMIITIKDSNLL